MSLILKNVNIIGIKGYEDQGKVDISIDDRGTVIDMSTTSHRESIPTRQMNIERKTDTEILDLENCYLSPGWIDLHTHIYYGVSNLGVDPDCIGPESGVSILVDAGSAGSANFKGFRKYIIDKKDYPIYSFLNIGATGLMMANTISELDNLDKIDLDKMFEVIEENREYIKGIKLRASGVILRGWGVEIVKLAKRAAVEAGLPLIVHVGEPLPLLEDILPCLDRGDIVTHCYHGKRWGIFSDGDIIPEVINARQRGIIFDVGHGEASFNFNVAVKAIEMGFKPDTISTDLHQHNLDGPVWDLATTMSKLLAIGMDVIGVIKSVTEKPAKILGIDSYNKGLEGKKARFTVFTMENKEIQVKDSNNNRLRINKIFKPEWVIQGDKKIKAATNNKNFQR